MAPAWEELAEELKNVPHLIIADIDSTLNEVEGADIKGFPTLKFYPRGLKSAAPLDFEGERAIEAFRDYLKEHSQAYKQYLNSATDL
jgi:Thioredoxin